MIENKYVKIALIGLCALCLILAGVLIWREIDARKPPAILPIIVEATPQNTPEPTPASEDIVINDPTGTQKDDSVDPSPIPPTATANGDTVPVSSSSPVNATRKPSDTSTAKTAFGMLTVNTASKSKSFEVVDDVSENSLKKHVGWLAGSAIPGSEGMCVLLGHRDTDFRILKDVNVGDALLFTTESGDTFVYIVESAKIIEADEVLRFTATQGKTMALVTCFPFYYSGHAPHKYLVMARMP